MRYLFIFSMSFFVSLTGFSQGTQTVTLVFVTSANTYNNFEAVVDDVSYYSENSSSYNNQNHTQTSTNKRNTIWLNNFQPGRHKIEVYSLRDGYKEERANNPPVYSSTFTVRDGFDTKIAIRNNGQVQFSERQSDYNNSVENDVKKDNGIYSPVNDNAVNNNTGGVKINRGENNNHVNTDRVDNNSVDNNSQINDGTYRNDTTNGTVRRSTKRTDNSLPGDRDINTPSNDNNGNNSRSYDDGSSARKGNINRGDEIDSQREAGNNNTEAKSKVAMSDYQFNYLYETISNQWLPGQKMKTLTNEFLNSGNNFTTMQAKKLIELVTEEGNRLQLAKSSYHSITDPEHFSQVYALFRNQATKDGLDKFLDNYHE